MNSCDILVHFQGKIDWCALVQTANFEQVMINDVANVALSRYNSVYRSHFQISQCTICVIDNYDEKTMKVIEDPENVEIKASQEIILILPDQAVNEDPQLNIDDYINLNNQAISFIEQSYLSAAQECFKLIKNVIFDNDDENFWMKIKPLKGLTLKEYKILPNEAEIKNVIVSQDPIYKEKKMLTVAEYIQKCSIVGYNKKQIREFLDVIVKTEPAVALEIALKNPEQYKHITKLCRDKTVLEMLPAKISSMGIKSVHLINFTEAFISRASLSQALYFLKEVREHAGSGDPLITKYYASYLLIDRDLTKLHEVLFKFFKANQSCQLGSNNLILFYTLLEKLKKNPPQPPIQIPPILHYKVKSSDINIVIILLILAIYFFIKGDIEFFISMRNFMESIVFTQNNCKIMSQVPLISLFRSCYSASFHFTEPFKKKEIPKIYILGDECAAFCANRNYEGIGPVDCHLIDNLSISLIRDENNSPGKDAFWNRIQEVKKYKVLVLVLGNIDLRISVQLILSREFEVSFDAIFERIANIYIKIIEKI